jgi:hypothetical protein
MALLLSLLLLAALCACGGGNEAEGPSEEDTPKYVYVASYTELPTEITDMYNCFWYDDGLYFVGSKKSGTSSYTDPTTGEVMEYDNYAQGLFYVKQDGTGLAELPDYDGPKPPEGMEGNGSINRLTVDAEGNLWVCENLYAYAPTDDGSGGGAIPYEKRAYASASRSHAFTGRGRVTAEPIEKYYIRKLDSTVRRLLSVDLSSFAEETAAAAENGEYKRIYSEWAGDWTPPAIYIS